MVADLDDIDQAGEVHPLFRLWAEERDRVVKTAKVAVAAGGKARAVEITEEQACNMADLLRATFNDPQLGITKEQREGGIKAFARRMRATETSAHSEELAWAREVFARQRDGCSTRPRPKAY